MTHVRLSGIMTPVDRSQLDPAELYSRIGRRLRTTREEQRLTQEELAARAGLQRTSVTNIERGRQHPPLHVLYSLCDALGVEVSSMLPSSAEIPRLFGAPPSAPDLEVTELARALRRKIGGEA